MVTSPAFREGEPIPARYTCRGAPVVPLAWSGVPEDARSLAVVVRDPDAPRGTFVHWVVHGIAPTVTALDGPPPGAHETGNDSGGTGWFAPCPPSGTHRYLFTVYALREPVRAEHMRAAVAQIERNALVSGTLMGTVTA